MPLSVPSHFSWAPSPATTDPISSEGLAMTAATDRRESLPPWMPRWWPYYAFAVSIIAVASLVLGVAGVYTNGRQDAVAAAENKARDEQNSELLACFDEYAAASSESSTAVREASVEKDRATTIRDDALAAEGDAFQAVVDNILADTLKPAQVKRLAETLAARARAAKLLDAAQDALDKAREDNPVPEPPSTFCHAKP